MDTILRLTDFILKWGEQPVTTLTFLWHAFMFLAYLLPLPFYVFVSIASVVLSSSSSESLHLSLAFFLFFFVIVAYSSSSSVRFRLFSLLAPLLRSFIALSVCPLFIQFFSIVTLSFSLLPPFIFSISLLFICGSRLLRQFYSSVRLILFSISSHVFSSLMFFPRASYSPTDQSGCLFDSSIFFVLFVSSLCLSFSSLCLPLYYFSIDESLSSYVYLIVHDYMIDHIFSHQSACKFSSVRMF